VANGKLSRAQVGLALASALVVMLASGVAISRIAESDDESTAATGPSSTSSSVPGVGGSGPATDGGTGGGAATGDAADQAPPASDAMASDESAVVHGVTRTARKAGAKPGASGSASAATGAPTTSGSGPPAGSSGSGGDAPSGGAQEGGQDSPPAPSQEKVPLASASVSAGEGAQGAVVGLGLGNGGKPVDPDVTIGTTPLVGDHPPSEGTGVSFGGQLLQSSPTLPWPPG
jgi:hypothetical protein